MASSVTPTVQRERRIVEAFKTQPGPDGTLTRRELAERIGCYPSLLQHALNRLQRRGVVRIVGHRRSQLTTGITTMGAESEALALSPEAAS